MGPIVGRYNLRKIDPERDQKGNPKGGQKRAQKGGPKMDHFTIQRGARKEHKGPEKKRGPKGSKRWCKMNPLLYQRG